MTWGKEMTKLGPYQGTKGSETVRKLECKGASVARFTEMTTASVNRMARPGEMTESDGCDK